MYQVIIKREALKELKVLPKKMVITITTAIDGLSKDPRPYGYKKLKGSEEDLWRIRVGDYRIIYTIDDVIRIVNVRKIGNRRDIYQ